eukprot:GEZU01021402.1.p1 GENE.GEZU01021402.1~~GEZU01021402.1.p1  ORF type:complete len:382 (+),score=49.42 GEZU01021402.1:22-1146(+)
MLFGLIQDVDLYFLCFTVVLTAFLGLLLQVHPVSVKRKYRSRVRSNEKELLQHASDDEELIENIRRLLTRRDASGASAHPQLLQHQDSECNATNSMILESLQELENSIISLKEKLEEEHHAKTKALIKIDELEAVNNALSSTVRRLQEERRCLKADISNLQQQLEKKSQSETVYAVSPNIQTRVSELIKEVDAYRDEVKLATAGTLASSNHNNHAGSVSNITLNSFKEMTEDSDSDTESDASALEAINNSSSGSSGEYDAISCGSKASNSSNPSPRSNSTTTSNSSLSMYLLGCEVGKLQSETENLKEMNRMQGNNVLSKRLKRVQRENIRLMLQLRQSEEWIEQLAQQNSEKDDKIKAYEMLIMDRKLNKYCD